MNNKSMTLLEIIISMLILSAVTIGIANVFVAAKKHISINRSKIVAVQLGRYYMDILQVNVTQENWEQLGNDLNTGTYPQIDNGLNGITYRIMRNVGVPVSMPNLRKVYLNISWNEPS